MQLHHMHERNTGSIKYAIHTAHTNAGSSATITEK
jgi:hypothetical protein